MRKLSSENAAMTPNRLADQSSGLQPSGVGRGVAYGAPLGIARGLASTAEPRIHTETGRMLADSSEMSSDTTSRSICMRAPTRIDLGGGWTDVPPYCDNEGGFVCNVAIDRYATATLSANGEVGATSSADAPLMQAAF